MRRVAPPTVAEANADLLRRAAREKALVRQHGVVGHEIHRERLERDFQQERGP